MGLVKYGGGITQISGSIGGDVHARNRSGNYIRPRTKPINPNTALQVAARACISFLVEYWAETLTQAQRDAWDLYASNVAMLNRLGETTHLTGMNMFVRGNAFRTRYSIALVPGGPVVFTIADSDPTLSIAISEATNQVTVTFDDTMAWASEDGAFLTMLNGAPQNPQRTFFGGPYKGIRYLTGAAGAPLASPLPLGGIYTMSQGQRVWCQFRIYRADGRVSNPFDAQIVVAA